MNILVVLRAVRDPAGFTVNRKAEKIFVNREAFIFNPSDRNALEAGLALAAQLTLTGEGCQVTAVAYGGEQAEDLLREAVAMGANRAVLVAEPALELADASSLTAVLKQVVAAPVTGGADLVLLGADVLDADLAQVGPRLAEALGWPFVEGAHQVAALGNERVAPGASLPPANSAGGRRMWTLVVAAGSAFQAGEYRLVQVDGQVVASVARDSNRPRFAPAPRIIQAYTTPRAVEALTLSDLDLTVADIAPLARKRGESFPAERTYGAVLNGADDENVRLVVEALRQL